jgi:solute carrier family 25 phosphate transporter 3
MAGIMCAVASHPSDTIVSKLYSQGKSSENVEFATKISNIYKEIGWKGLWAGLGTRVLMIGTIAGLQWWIYDSFKTMIGLQTTGGVVKKV